MFGIEMPSFLSYERLTIIFIIAEVILIGYQIQKRYRRKIVSSPPEPVSEKKDEKPVQNDRNLAVDFTGSSSTSAVPLKPRRLVKVDKKDLKKKTSTVASTHTKITILFSTLAGSSERYANKLRDLLTPAMNAPVEVLNMDYIDDLDDYFVKPKEDLHNTLILFVVPSYETECPLDYIIELLKETYHDFRIDSAPLRNLAGFSVFGIGDSESWPERQKYCYQARQVDKYMGKLGARRVFPMGTGCIKTTIDTQFEEYVQHLINELENPSDVSEIALEDLVDSGDESEEEDIESMQTDQQNDYTVMDVEDMGRSAPKRQTKAEIKTGAKEMVAKNSPTYKALTKQGYAVVGTHSGVKICRWTKSALRGRGSCYKFAFYGIRSHLCMETTPSLSCSNKCVFCWRHGTNPVGTTWRWQVDQPRDIIEGALTNHYRKIKEMRGVPGIQAARFAEAFRVRHCALSLVGEPIFYPHINEFLEMLHAKHISSFLVCNAQHPAELSRLKRVTQLYVSIDASDKQSLKRVDRPLHRDFWERMMECLDILKSRKDHRTVYRLTLVKGFNSEDVEGYADMIERGEPCFVEVKGVTFCGTSSSNTLRMSNVPFYDEVVSFVTALNEELENRGLDYGLATEHAHSCCILMAQNRFKIDGKWYTHIDYPKFFELLESGKPFGPMDYIAETPEWAYFGSEAQGFNPEDIRHRKGKPIE